MKSAFCCCFPLFATLRYPYRYARVSFPFLRLLYFYPLLLLLLPRATLLSLHEGILHFALLRSTTLCHIPIARICLCKLPLFSPYCAFAFFLVIFPLCACKNAPLFLTVCAYKLARPTLRPSAATRPGQRTVKSVVLDHVCV